MAYFMGASLDGGPMAIVLVPRLESPWASLCAHLLPLPPPSVDIKDGQELGDGTGRGSSVRGGSVRDEDRDRDLDLRFAV